MLTNICHTTKTLIITKFKKPPTKFSDKKLFEKTF